MAMSFSFFEVFSGASSLSMPCVFMSLQNAPFFAMRDVYVPISCILPSPKTTTWFALGKYWSAFVTRITVLFLSSPVMTFSKMAEPT